MSGNNQVLAGNVEDRVRIFFSKENRMDGGRATIICT
ncbi:hypothetical protein B2K_39020 [Paenibacillus mucilaginosus K02]|uniref:Uncharacterized protein n=1 Tax=Paenibacillus mucilaginosus K02 TaxID=997761 RepID=R9UPR8_9BACL|nr:hypothetical protein B2K_39020 [Paenibacillus mucilaginosus K02]